MSDAAALPEAADPAEAELDDSQFYNGTAQVYVPIIRDAINARATRFDRDVARYLKGTK